MKLICAVDGEKKYGFQEKRIVVEIAQGCLREADIRASAYSSGGNIEIKSGRVGFNPRTLHASCSGEHAASLLLNLEICKFISEQMPELCQLVFNKNIGVFVSGSDEAAK